MFRVRESFLGKSILQASDFSGEGWVDVEPMGHLVDGFNIVSIGHLHTLYERLNNAEERLKAYAAAVNAARRSKKKLPVLTEAVG